MLRHQMAFILLSIVGCQGVVQLGGLVPGFDGMLLLEGTLFYSKYNKHLSC